MLLEPIPGFEGYSVTSAGQVYSHKQSKFLKPCKRNDGYLNIGLTVGGVRKRCLVHRLIALAFLGKSDLDVNHINGIKYDNRLENLEYLSHADNIRHGFLAGLYDGRILDKTWNAKLTIADVKQIKDLHYSGNMSQRYLARLYGVGKSTINSIFIGRNWKGV